MANTRKYRARTVRLYHKSSKVNSEIWFLQAFETKDNKLNSWLTLRCIYLGWPTYFGNGKDWTRFLSRMYVYSLFWWNIGEPEWKSILRSKYATGRVKNRDVLTSKVFVSSAGEDLRGRNVSFFTLPVAYFARKIDFRSYADTTMNLYSIIGEPLHYWCSTPCTHDIHDNTWYCERMIWWTSRQAVRSQFHRLVEQFWMMNCCQFIGKCGCM